MNTRYNTETEQNMAFQQYLCSSDRVKPKQKHPYFFRGGRVYTVSHSVRFSFSLHLICAPCALWSSSFISSFVRWWSKFFTPVFSALLFLTRSFLVVMLFFFSLVSLLLLLPLVCLFNSSFLCVHVFHLVSYASNDFPSQTHIIGGVFAAHHK